jgi:hypothetical protein
MNTPPIHRQPLFWWAAVVMLALLSSYVHVLNLQVEQGALRREAFGKSAPRSAAERLPAAAAVTRTAQR